MWKLRNKVGTIAMGYEISSDEFRNILKFRGWGMWDSAVASQFEQVWTKAIAEVSTRGRDWYILADLTDFPPQSIEVQDLTKRMLVLEIQQGVKKEAHLVSQILTQWQIARIAKETNLSENSFFQSEDKAIQWLMQEAGKP